MNSGFARSGTMTCNGSFQRQRGDNSTASYSITERPPPIRSRSGTAAARGLPRVLTLTVLLTLLHFVLLLAHQAAAQEEDVATTTTTTKRPTPTKTREKGLAKHICKGTQKFTNTIDLLLTFGKKVLEDPRPLKIGERLGSERDPQRTRHPAAPRNTSDVL
ncbi:uncharacterized protein LOC119387939 [Rhipicephalus sanguineus]|uniref:uncharacterized protein LOC119387939 n=1 Tax=Rhipicephalus sanguineus TaxID=34632 RepID=UPI0020C25BED|nr:uncharacterized protein LOC119387939 [Rhipicephalus sanguineus]